MGGLQECEERLERAEWEAPLEREGALVQNAALVAGTKADGMGEGRIDVRSAEFGVVVLVGRRAFGVLCRAFVAGAGAAGVAAANAPQHGPGVDGATRGVGVASDLVSHAGRCRMKNGGARAWPAADREH
jgi:hypothetical protein